VGKAAENEKRKLVATFRNNSAIALYVSGALLPLLVFMSKAPAFGPWFINWLAGSATFDQIEALTTFAVILSSLVALSGATWLHRRALQALDQFED